MFKQKIKEYLPEGEIQKEKKEKRKLPKVRSDGKGIRIFIWICIFLIAISGMLGYLKSMKVEGIAQNNQKTLEKMQSDEGNIKTSDYESNRLLLFTNDFIEKYINIPNSMEDRSKYQETLSEYFADGLEQEEVSANGYRRLKSSEYFDTIVYSNYSIVQYKVTYANVSVVEKERTKTEKYKEDGKEKEREVKETYQEEEESEVTALINIPVKAKDGTYTVVENIYFSAIPTLETNEISSIPNSLENKEEVSLSQKENVEEFLLDFFQKYAESPTSDLSYVMKEPEGLNGIKEFVEISDFKAYENGEKIVVKAISLFKDTGTEFTTKENFTLVLVKRDTNYFVEKMTHTLGGNE